MAESPESVLKLTEEERAHYRDALVQVGANKPCARCDYPFDGFGIVPAKHPVQFFQLAEAISGVQEAHMLTIVTMCTNCGALSMHAANLLDTKTGIVGAGE